MRRTGITVHTIAQLQALTTITPQLGDQVMVSDLAHAVFKYIPGTATDDGINVLIQNDGTNDHVWVRQGINLLGTFDVPYSALGDNTSAIFEVEALTLKRDGAYLATVVSGEPANAAGAVADYARVRPTADDKLAVEITNNTGATLVILDVDGVTPIVLRLNIFQIGG